jgi:RNA polymerase sigma-70 factor (ECF subfamily)
MMEERLEAVLKTLYLLFNEGYNSSHTEKLIREDLCEEAMRLVILLTENPGTNLPQTNALLALLCYQTSRFTSRIDDKGYIILLKDQDRNLWNKFLIQKGNEYLSLAAKGEMLHEYHLEAAIASVHANAKSYEKTDWKMILGIYNKLLATTDNPVVAINRCVAIGEADNYHTALKELQLLKDMKENFYFLIVKGEVLMKAGNTSEAITAFNKALTLSSSPMETELIERKIKSCRMTLS